MTPRAFDEDASLDPYALQLDRLYLAGLITLEEEYELLDPAFRYKEES